MAFADPQSVTINAVANSLPRTAQDPSGIFSKDDGTVALVISHAPVGNKRMRHNIRLNHSKIASDPFTAGNSLKYSMSAYLVVDVPFEGGYTVAEQKQVVDGLVAYLAASTGAKVTQLLANEK